MSDVRENQSVHCMPPSGVGIPEGHVAVYRRGFLDYWHSPYTGLVHFVPRPLPLLRRMLPHVDFGLCDGPTAALRAVARLWPHWSQRKRRRFVADLLGVSYGSAASCDDRLKRGQRNGGAA
jgi:hypothetical protein